MKLEIQFGFPRPLLLQGIWKPSLEIKTKNGASYLVNVSHPKDLADKINGILEQQEEPSEPVSIMEQVA